MGVNIKRNKKGLYNMESSITDSSIHPENKWVTEDEAKKILIDRELWRFIEKIIEIDMEFPMNYHVNGGYCQDKKPRYCNWWLDNSDDKDFDNIINNAMVALIRDFLRNLLLALLFFINLILTCK